MSKRWNLDEFIICLDLYLRRGAIGNNDDEVKRIATIIGRTPAAVALRLGNFQFVDPKSDGPGLSGGEKQCELVWSALASNPKLVSELAEIARGLR